jgi:hypothetical protein
MQICFVHLQTKYNNLLTTAKTHEEMAAKAAREGQLRAEELRLLRAEAEQLRAQNLEVKRKAQVELESLQEQLRVRKEKQYQLLEKMSASEEAKRQAEDQVSAMEEKLRTLHGRTVEVETQLQVEARMKRSQEEANKTLAIDNENISNANKALQEKISATEEERLRMEVNLLVSFIRLKMIKIHMISLTHSLTHSPLFFQSELRDSGEQLREMAEKVFQLLERLKLAELGKSKAIEALKQKDQEVLALKKKNSRLIKESTQEGKARVKAELDKKVLLDQLKALKTHNQTLSSRCKAEVTEKLKEHEARKAAQEKVRIMGGRLTFLLNKLQADEEVKVVQQEEMKKLEAQLRTGKEHNNELEEKLTATSEVR